MNYINIIGGGLAGSEAAYYLANRGVNVRLFEMRPHLQTPAHTSGHFGELVCSNSLKSKQLTNACGLLKAEMEQLGSLMLEAANATEVPSGNALSVDRELFAKYIDDKVRHHPFVEVIEEEAVTIPPGITIIASGPLTSDGLTKTLQKLIGGDLLRFFDASAPIVEKSSLDLDKVYYKSRYEQGDNSYLNAAMSKEEYELFYHELINAKRAPVRDIDTQYFEGCMPVEVMAARGVDTLRYGPLKPRGLRRTPEDRPYAVIQLRQDNVAATLYNIVGFQTNLTYSEQQRVFRLIPGLENAEFVRYGLMHRNSYVNAPLVLKPNLEVKNYPGLFIAGQLSGVEGYVESAASGIYAAINALAILRNKPAQIAPQTTVLGALIHYITHANPEAFAPMNANFGIVPDTNKRERELTIERSLSAIKVWKEGFDE